MSERAVSRTPPALEDSAPDLLLPPPLLLPLVPLLLDPPEPATALSDTLLRVVGIFSRLRPVAILP
jgi:hypothetical protein